MSSLLPTKQDATFEASTLRVYHATLVKRRIGLALLLALILAAVVFDILVGPAQLRVYEIVGALLNRAQADPVAEVIVWQLRLPQALLALAVGLALGLAGAEMQTILNNPLASPFTLGLSSAAALGASLALVFQWGIPGVPAAWLVAANAFVFAVLCALLLDWVARWSAMSTAGVVLFGIALVFSFNAIVSLVQFVASAEALQGLVFWTLGSLERATWVTVAILLAAFVVVLPLSMRSAWRLTALRMGEERAASFGIDVSRARLASLLRISVLAALAVAFAGTIGFIGLVAPHIARRLFGEDHRFYLPGSALVGGVILTLASLASKVMVPGLVIPLGIVTSLIGVPFFMAVVFRRPAA